MFFLSVNQNKLVKSHHKNLYIYWDKLVKSYDKNLTKSGVLQSILTIGWPVNSLV